MRQLKNYQNDFIKSFATAQKKNRKKNVYKKSNIKSIGLPLSHYECKSMTWFEG